ncbi:MAG: hypothetical protein K9M57_00280 [Phycisphaerae bacterium]|nr:hypothetical protein [Phycisphaerae bacterium]
MPEYDAVKHHWRTDEAVISDETQGHRSPEKGHKGENKGRFKTWWTHEIYHDKRMKKHLKKDSNVIAATSSLQYFHGKDGNIEVCLEGLEKCPGID